MKTIYLIAGARPNFMKIAPIVRALQRQATLAFKIVHTGQHYDRDMNEVFFEELGIPKPDLCLEAGGGSHASQTAKVMIGFESLCLQERPDCVLVVGDVNSTMACAIVAKKLNLPVAHVEAGLRSGDMSMPEEINRLVTDAISDWFFATEAAAVEHLLREGKSSTKIHYVGHVMVDNVLYQLKKLLASERSAMASTKLKARLQANGPYGVVTLHRPGNVDTPLVLQSLARALRNVSEHIPLVFPVHPRTRAMLMQTQTTLGANVILTGPLAYMEFLDLWREAAMVLTDSGGLQEETTALGIPCLTLRNNTERPITIDAGSNILVGTDPIRIKEEALHILHGKGKKGRCPPMWDGHAAERIIDILSRELAPNSPPVQRATAA